jgi:hypothetical protein
VTDRVYPAVQPLEPSDTDAVLDRARPDAERAELGMRHHAMLAVGERR